MKINPAQLHPIKPLKVAAQSAEEKLASAEEVQKAYRDFVGKTFFGQMLKSMRETVGEPAYFSGGQAEKVFRSQLDQQLADNMAHASASQIADPMFRREFPREARLIDDAAKEKQSQLGSRWEALSNLRRR